MRFRAPKCVELYAAQKCDMYTMANVLSGRVQRAIHSKDPSSCRNGKCVSGRGGWGKLESGLHWGKDRRGIKNAILASQLHNLPLLTH